MNVFYRPKEFKKFFNVEYRQSSHNNIINMSDGLNNVMISLEELSAEECYQLSDLVLTIAHSKDPFYEAEIMEQV